jgi:hypothetical protein
MVISIYQICYSSQQHRGVDKDFILYDNSHYCNVHSKVNNPREYQVFVDNYKSISSDYTGYISWKFYSKTKITGIEFINNISTADVYFINCGPRSISNVWRQGEHQHPGLIKFTQRVIDSVGYDIDINSLSHDVSKTAFCNFWVGNKEFWSKYMKFTLPIYDYITNHLSEDQEKFLRQRACKGINSDYFPFIMERLFTTLLHLDSSIKYVNIPRRRA